MIELCSVTCRFAGVWALVDFDLRVERGQVCGLIGPNGSGKSTAVHLIAGACRCDAGAIRLECTDITRMPVYQRARLGIARTFQSVRLFDDLTLEENLIAASWGNPSEVPTRHRRKIEIRHEAERLLSSLGLLHRAGHIAADLSFGERRRLEIARALISRPKLLLLDEPAAGLTSDEVLQLGDTLLALRSQEVTVVLVEHVLDLVRRAADKVVVLGAGRKQAEGTPAMIFPPACAELQAGACG